MPLARSRERRALIALLLVSLAAFAALRMATLSVPFERDEGEYAYIAWRMLEGDVPYRDAFDQKPPGIFLAYAAAFSTLGRSVEAVHVFMQLWTLGTLLALWGVMRRLAGELAAGWSVLAFVLASVDPALSATAANTEIFMLWPMTASLLALLRGLEDDRARWWLAAGAGAAAACWFKQVAATHAIFLAVAACAPPVDTLRAGPAAAARRLGWLLLGGLALSLPVVVWFAAAGALGPFIDAVFLHNLTYARSESLASGLGNLVFAALRQLPSLGGLWLLAGAGLFWPRLAPGRVRALLGGWLLASLAGVALGLHFRPHYFIQALPALAALSGLALAAATRRVLALDSAAARGAALTAMIAALLLPPLVVHRDIWLADSPEQIARRIYGLNPFPEAEEIGRYIARTSEPEDSVYVVGSEPQILFHAERRSATRYIFFYPLTAGFEDSGRRQREAMAEVEASRPRYVVWTHVPTSLQRTSETDPFIFEASDELLQRAYQLEFVVRPDAGTQGYEFSYGDDGVRWLKETAEQLGQLPWLGVYRRAR